MDDTKMPDKVIFCDGYVYIPHTLQLLQKYRSTFKITLVICGFPDLYKYFCVINEKVFANSINVVDIKLFQPARIRYQGIKKIPYFFPDIINEKRYLKSIFNKYFSGFQNAEVIVFTQGFSGAKIYLLRKMLKTNRLVQLQLPLGLFEMSQTTPKTVIELAKVLLWKVIYDRAATIGTLPHYRGFIMATDNFVKKLDRQSVSPRELAEMMADYDPTNYKVFKTGSYSIIYFGDNLIGIGFISNSDALKNELSEIFKVVKKHFPDEKLAYKFHPGYTGGGILVDAGDTLPSYVPSEFLDFNDVKLYLGIFSKSLADIENGTVISFADLVTFKDNEIKRQMKEAFLKICKTKVRFPQSLQELDKVLNEISNKNS